MTCNLLAGMRVHRAIWILLLPLIGCAPQQQASQPAEPCMQVGMASWYRPTTSVRTASGEKPAADALTAAHRSLPFGTNLLVTEVASGRSVVVRVSDRGPFKKDRVIDLSAAAAKSLGIRQDGVAEVRLEIYRPSGDSGSQDRCLFDQTVES
jgi:rare lipoprotein A